MKAPSKKKGASEQWGIVHSRDLTTGDAVDGIIHSVTAKGIRISVGRDVIVSCYFGGISPYFIPQDKTVQICQKYFPRGKKVKVIVEKANKKFATAKMAENYIDAEAEGLTMSKKRKVELELTKTEEKPEKIIKIDMPPPEAEVKKEPVAICLADAAEMDIEFDTIESELEKRAIQDGSRKEQAEVKENRVGTLEEVEETQREAEREMETAKLPEDVSGWERACIAAPNNSEVWLRYSTFHITSGEIEKVTDLGYNSG